MDSDYYELVLKEIDGEHKLCIEYRNDDTDGQFEYKELDEHQRKYAESFLKSLELMTNSMEKKLQGWVKGDAI